jgi:MarR family transcriptional regulator, organic hydroperoxide resistance regulator
MYGCFSRIYTLTKGKGVMYAFFISRLIGLMRGGTQTMLSPEDGVGRQLILLRGAQQHYMDRALRELGLYCGQDTLLLLISHEEGLTQVQLAQRVSCEPQTINKTLQRMQKAGLVERRSDPDDGRLTRIYLTAQGRALVSPLQEIVRSCEQRLTAGLTREERLLVRRLLMHMRGNFDVPTCGFSTADEE